MSTVGGERATDERFRLGIAGCDLWLHTANFCRTLAEVDFAHITAVWDEDPPTSIVSSR